MNEDHIPYDEIWDGYASWGMADLEAGAAYIKTELERLDGMMDESMTSYRQIEDGIFVSEETREEGRKREQERKLERERTTFVYAYERTGLLGRRLRIIQAMVQHRIMRPSDAPPLWEDLSQPEQDAYVRSDDTYRPYSDESEFHEIPVYNGEKVWRRRDAVWNRYLRFIANRYYEMLGDHTQDRMALLIRDKLKEEFQIDTKTFGKEQLSRVMDTHRRLQRLKKQEEARKSDS